MDAADCLACRTWSPSLSAARYAFVLEPPADDLVHALKYEGWPELADFMGQELARLDLPETVSSGRSAVVPVPTTSGRLRSRGYNQAELLARRLAEDRHLPMCRAILRTAEGLSQTSLTPAERRENVRGAFSQVDRAVRLIGGAHVVLVDDVLTTGATASEAAATLMGMGAATVTLVAFGRALATRPRRHR